MRRRLALLTWLFLDPASWGADMKASRDFDWREYDRREGHIREVSRKAQQSLPRRRDEPLREINISDEEVREIELLVRDYLPRVIVNIGPVVTGCPCEEGRDCKEQVYLQANTDTGSVGLQLSRIANRWDVSKVQKWWLRWQALRMLEAKLNWLELHERQWELAQDFPVCTPVAPAPQNISANSGAEPRK
jgi:hypothetical protein